MTKQHINPVHLIIPKMRHGIEVRDKQKYSMVTTFFKDFPGLTFSEAESTKACDIVSAIESSGQSNVLVLCQHMRIDFISKDVCKGLSSHPRTVLLVGFSHTYDFMSIVSNVSYALASVIHTHPMLARTYNGCTKRVS